MKSPKETESSQAKLARIQKKLAGLESTVNVARQKAKAAKAAFKVARKTFKDAKKVAKEVRKDLKALKSTSVKTTTEKRPRSGDDSGKKEPVQSYSAELPKPRKRAAGKKQTGRKSTPKNSRPELQLSPEISSDSSTTIESSVETLDVAFQPGVSVTPAEENPSTSA